MMRCLRWLLRQAFMLWLIAMCCAVLALLWVDDEIAQWKMRLREWKKEKCR